jgi:2-polyprenyl-3-methyl-5-hydroxy-6-metoxy-1,4-benzoquinol methylase
MTHDLHEFFSESFWNERYSGGQQWSGQPNPQLVSEISGVRPGTALDVGCGEGGDAIWLARQGWQVTAYDISTVALQRAAEHSDGLDITWVQGDLLEKVPAGPFDLVSAHFVHLPPPQREVLHQRMAAAVAPGGYLLVVGHHPSDMEAAVKRPPIPDLYFTAEEVAASLPAEEWTTVTADKRARSFQDMVIHDTITLLRRR